MPKMRHTAPESYLWVPELGGTPRVGSSGGAICARRGHGYLPPDSVQQPVRPLRLESRMNLLECVAGCVRPPLLANSGVASAWSRGPDSLATAIVAERYEPSRFAISGA